MNTARDLIQLFPRITSQSLGVRVREHKINKLIVGPNERLITSYSKGLMNIKLTTDHNFIKIQNKLQHVEAHFTASFHLFGTTIFIG